MSHAWLLSLTYGIWGTPSREADYLSVGSIKCETQRLIGKSGSTDHSITYSRHTHRDSRMRFPKTISASKSDGFICVFGCAFDSSVRPSPS